APDDRGPVVPKERCLPLHLLPVNGELEEAPATAHVDAVTAEHLQLRLEVPHHDRRGPAELDEVDVAFGHLEHPFRLGDRQTLVEDLGETGLAGLLGATRVAEDLRALSAGDDSRLRGHGRPSSTPRAMQASSDARRTPSTHATVRRAPAYGRTGGAAPG